MPLQSYPVQVKHHRLVASVGEEDGRRVLEVEGYRLHEGTNGRFVGGSYPVKNRLREVIDGRMSAEDYVAAVRRDVDLRFALHALYGQKVARVLRRLKRGRLVGVLD